MAFEATKNFKKKSAGGRFEATDRFDVDSAYVSGKLSKLQNDYSKLISDYEHTNTEMSKYVMGEKSFFDKLQAPGYKAVEESPYRERALKIKKELDLNKDFMDPESYLAYSRNLNSILDDNTSKDSISGFSEVFRERNESGISREDYRKQFEKSYESQEYLESVKRKYAIDDNTNANKIIGISEGINVPEKQTADKMSVDKEASREYNSEKGRIERTYGISLSYDDYEGNTVKLQKIMESLPAGREKQKILDFSKINPEEYDYAQYVNSPSSVKQKTNLYQTDRTGTVHDEEETDILKRDKAALRQIAAERITMDDWNAINEGNAYENIASDYKVSAIINDAMSKADFEEKSNISDEEKESLRFDSSPLSTSETAKKKFFGGGTLDSAFDLSASYDEITNGMSDEEKNVFNYILNTEGKTAATEYRQLLNRDSEFYEDIGSRKGREFYEKNLKGHPILTALYSVPAGFFGQFGSSIQSAGDFALGTTPDPKEHTELSTIEAAKQDHGALYNVLLDLGVNLGDNAPSWIIGGAAGAAAKGFGAAVKTAQGIANTASAGTMFLSAGSAAYSQAIEEGYSAKQAQNYGVITGLSEAFLEKALGGIAGMGGKITGKSVEAAIKNIEKAGLRMLAEGTIDMAGEFTEEYLQEILDPVFRNITLDENNEFKPFTADALYAGMLGALSAATVNAGPLTVDAVSYASSKAKNAIDTAAAIKKVGNQITGTDAGKNLLEIAEKRGFDISKASEEVPEGRGIGKLVSKVRNAARNRNMGKLAQDVVEAELKAAKETAMPIVNNNESLAEMVAEIATGTADVSAISVLSANGVLTEENVGKVFEALEAVQKRTETSEVRNMINDIVETKESSEGKAYNASSIYGIKREGGKTKYILEDGTEVDSSEFGLTSKDKTLFVNAVKGMTDAEANEMISAYRKYANGTDKGVFATTWGLYRSLGETGAAKNGERVAEYKSRIYFTQNAEVNNVLVTSAIEQGVKARAQSEMKRNIKARAERVIQERGRAKGEVRGEEHLGKNKSGAKNVARTLAKLGYDVEFLSEDAKLHGERIGETLKNGAYDEKTNTIYLRADAAYNATDVRGILGHTLAHEVTHSIKTWSEADYNVLTDYIRDALGADFDALVKDKMNKLNMGYTMASDEVIADGCEMLLRDSKALEKLAMENANLFVKVVTKVREFIANLRKAQTDMYGGNEELHDAALKLKEVLKSLEEVQKVFDNALENSIRNMRDALAEAENAKTRENLDILEKQAEKEGLQLSEETADEFAKNEKDAAEKALANMSVRDYNRRGWLRTLLTREDASKLNSAVAEIFTGKRRDIRLKDGSYAVEVNNKIVFVSGTFENPRYESVLVFNTDNATDMEALKYYFFGDTATNDLTVKDIKRFINQRRNYGQIYGFNGEDYKASGKRDYGRAKLRNGAKGFGDISQFEIRDGVHTKDEGSVSVRVQGLKFSEETETSRDTLVSDMEAVAETDEEKSFVEKLKSEVKKANALQKELAEVNRKIKEISFTKGADRSVLPSLNEERERIAKKLNRLDSKFYGYRGYDTFKTLAERKSKEAVIAERLRGKEALRSQKQKYQEAAQGIKDTLAQREEDRRRREIARDIAKRIDKIDSIAKADSKTKHIPSALRQIVRDFRAAVDTRTQNYDERIAKVNEAVKKLEGKRSKYDVGSAEYEELSAQIEKKLALAETYGMRGEKAEKYLDGILEYYKTYGDGKSGTYLVTDELTSIIEDMKSIVGERPLYMLSADELEIVLNATKAVQKQIVTANKLFKSSRSVSDTVNVAASQTKDRRNTKAVKNPVIRKMLSAATGFFYYNNLKPYELFKITGSQEMYNLYRRLQRSEGDSARLITKYADKYRETAKKNGVKEGMFGKDTRITLDSGKTIVITQGEALTLHLTQRREQGRTHLLGEGFKPKDGIVRTVENGKVKSRSSADFITLTETDLSKFGEAAGKNLTAFGEEMQNYMSTEMSKDGNGVSMALYDVELFGEDNYISLDVDQSKRVMAIEKSTKPGRLENRGFTQKTVENATQGLLISSFDDVFASHATDMAAYAAFTLPLNDMMRVINGKTADGVQLKALFGEKLSNGIQDFLNDVNGGIRSDNLAIPALFRSFKAAATGANLRVVIQQPTAIMRSLSKLNPKHYEMFFSSNSRTRRTFTEQQKTKLLAEMGKYTSTWLVKELGGADINAKRSLGKEITYLGFRDTTAQGRLNTITEKQFWLAEKADQLTWMYIWSACKNEAIDKLTNRQKAHGIGYTYEDVLRMAGDRFDEVTNETQVYDSVFARSKIMRSSSYLAKLYTSFFAEPSTTLNMVYEMARKFSTGEVREAVKIGVSLIFNSLFNIAAAAVVDAMRDDDDDQNFKEKYIEALFSNLLDNFEPMGYMPYFRDLINALKGYDVNRSDVELVSRFVTKTNKLRKEIEKEPRNDRELLESAADFSLAVIDMFGIAGTNFKRDFMAIVDTVTKKSNWEKGTKTTLNSSIKDALNGTFRWGKEKSYSDKLYYAVMNEDSSYIKRMKESNDEDEYKSLIKKGLKDHDLRVASAAACHMDGDFDGYERYVNDIVKDGFDREHVVSAILSAENKLLKDAAEEDEDVELVYQIDGMTATKKDIYAEVEEGKYGLLEEYYRLKVDYYKEKEDEEPEKKAVTAVKNLLTSNYKEIYEDSDEDAKKKLREMLTDIKVDGHRLYTYDSIRRWDDK